MDQLQSEVQHSEKYTVQVHARLKPTTKKKLRELSEREGKKMSDTVREIVESYVQD